MRISIEFVHKIYMRTYPQHVLILKSVSHKESMCNTFNMCTSVSWVCAGKTCNIGFNMCLPSPRVSIRNIWAEAFSMRSFVFDSRCDGKIKPQYILHAPVLKSISHKVCMCRCVLNVLFQPASWDCMRESCAYAFNMCPFLLRLPIRTVCADVFTLCSPSLHNFSTRNRHTLKVPSYGSHMLIPSWEPAHVIPYVIEENGSANA